MSQQRPHKLNSKNLVEADIINANRVHNTHDWTHFNRLAISQSPLNSNSVFDEMVDKSSAKVQNLVSDIVSQFHLVLLSNRRLPLSSEGTKKCKLQLLESHQLRNIS